MIIRIHFFNFIYLFVYYLLNFLLEVLDFLGIILSMYMKIMFKIFFATLFPLFQDNFLQVYYFLNIVQPSFQALKILFPNPSPLAFFFFFTRRTCELKWRKGFLEMSSQHNLCPRLGKYFSTCVMNTITALSGSRYRSGPSISSRD